MQPPAESVVTPEDEYRLGSEDVIEVLVWKEPDLSKVVTVRPDGKISLPLVGDAQAAGLTAEELKNNIQEALTEYVDAPTVSVTVLNTHSMKFFVQGEVVSPGPISLQSNYTIMQAIALAGGFTDWANKKKIIVYRREGDKEYGIPINYDKIISGEDPSQNIFIRRGDTILVP
jgi:polysaccharide export outer membrane protein